MIYMSYLSFSLKKNLGVGNNAAQLESSTIVYPSTARFFNGSGTSFAAAKSVTSKSTATTKKKTAVSALTTPKLESLSIVYPMASTARFFSSSRTLFAAAKSVTPKSTATATETATAATTKKKTAVKKLTEKPTKKPKQASTVKPVGILKAAPVSPALAHFLGVSESARTDAVKKIWEYIKLHELQNPANKKEIICDDKLKTIFDGKDRVGFLEIAKLLTPHFVKTD